jgi:hypothetical protein
MSYEIKQINYDLIEGRVQVLINKQAAPEWASVNVSIPLAPQGTVSEHELKERAKQAAKTALEEAAKAL